MLVDNLTRCFGYDAGGHLVRLDEIGYGESGERPGNSGFERRLSNGNGVSVGSLIVRRLMWLY